MTSPEAKEPESDGSTEPDRLEYLCDAIKSLGARERMENKIDGLKGELDVFRHELKQDLEDVKTTLKTVEKSMENIWTRVEENSAKLKTQKDVSKTQQLEIDESKADLAKTKSLQNEEKENNTALENYTRRENLKFMNIQEHQLKKIANN